MQPIAFGLIGGTGVYRLADLEDVSNYPMTTPYGLASDHIRIGRFHGVRVAFLARHGSQHTLLPHQINYRANIDALAQCGVTRLIAINTVGGITDAFSPQVLACPDQLIDYTSGRETTYADGREQSLMHIDFTHPYTEELRLALIGAARQAAIALVPYGCYGVTQGPRLETAGEIRRMRRDGCDLVGMTGMPEACLAREKGIAYACLAISANWAAGCRGATDITLDDVLANVHAVDLRLRQLIKTFTQNVAENKIGR